MKLASLKSSGNMDGELCVVSRDLKRAVKATQIAPNVRTALEKWSDVEGSLKKLSDDLNSDKAEGSFAFDEKKFHSAMPRTWLFADGSAFIHHIKLVRMARKAPMPETLMTVPLMYQGECGRFLDSHEAIPQRDFAHGTDFEGEVGVITGHVPMGVTPNEAINHIKLFVIINDVSLRGLIPEELAAGFGFFQSKPASALSPCAVTADELGEAWKDGRIHLPLNVKFNGEFFGEASASAMHFHFGDLIAHAAKTRDLAAGTIIGSGTVSNDDQSKGSSCLAEKRTLEQIETGTPKTSFMKVGDRVEMKMLNAKGENIFGTISQVVEKRH